MPLLQDIQYRAVSEKDRMAYPMNSRQFGSYVFCTGLLSIDSVQRTYLKNVNGK